MIFLGEQNVELPCPDYTTANCRGKIKIPIQSYRVARGRGTFIITINKSPVICNRCGRMFNSQGIFPETNDYFFSPLRGKINERELKQSINNLNPLLQREILDKFCKFKKREKKLL